MKETTEQTKKKTRAAVLVPTAAAAVLLIAAAAVFIFIPTAGYYVKYHTGFYRGVDRSAAERVKDIPYSKYLQPMTVGDAAKLSAATAVFHSEWYKETSKNPLQAAVDKAFGNGGGIVIADENTTVDRLRLKSNICLYIPKDVTITVTGVRTEEDGYRFVEADEADNIVITGGGRLAGTGKAYWNTPNLVTITEPIKKYDIGVLEYLHFNQKYTRKIDVSTKFIVFNKCRNITVKNLIIEDSPGWNLSVEASETAAVSHLVIDSNYHGPNTDGIDISATSNVNIEDCYISAGDDAVCLKNDKFYNGEQVKEMKNIRVKNCFIRTATNGFKIGTGVYNNISDVTVSNLTIETEGVYPPAICGVTLLVSEGGTLSDVQVSNISIKNMLAPVFIRLSNRDKFGDKSMTGVLKNITVTDVEAVNAELPVIVSGVADAGKVCRVENIRLENFTIAYREARQSAKVNAVTDDDVKEAAKEYPEAWMMGDVPAYGVYIRHAKNVTVTGCRFTPRSGDTRAEISRYDCLNG